MSYFFALKNHISLTSNGEYIIGTLATIIPLIRLSILKKEIRFIKINKNIIYVNFNKHKLVYVICNKQVSIKKRIYDYTHYTHMWVT